MPDDSIDKFVTFAVDFFTYKDPRETPEFCGCLLSTVGMAGNAGVQGTSKRMLCEGSYRWTLTTNSTNMEQK